MYVGHTICSEPWTHILILKIIQLAIRLALLPDLQNRSNNLKRNLATSQIALLKVPESVQLRLVEK
jgi:hypothetical protein